MSQFFPIQNSIRRKIDSLSSCCAMITHRKCLELHNFVPILFGEDQDRLRITLVFLHKIFENLINTQSHGIKKRLKKQINNIKKLHKPT